MPHTRAATPATKPRTRSRQPAASRLGFLTVGGFIAGIVFSLALRLAAVRYGKDRGVRVTCEVTPHHLTMTDDYPWAQAFVIIEAIIDERGNVTNARVLKGLPMGLDRSALEAVQKWKFKPATFQGRAVKVYYTLTVNFQVQ